RLATSGWRPPRRVRSRALAVRLLALAQVTARRAAVARVAGPLAGPAVAPRLALPLGRARPIRRALSLGARPIGLPRRAIAHLAERPLVPPLRSAPIARLARPVPRRMTRRAGAASSVRRRTAGGSSLVARARPGRVRRP